MKKVKLLLLGLLALAPFVVSCSDDDDDEPKQPLPDQPTLPNYPTQQTAKAWTAAASHDYDLMVAAMEGYLEENFGVKGECFDNYNVAGVEDGRSGDNARSPKVEFKQDMFLVSVHTYHYFLPHHADGSAVVNKGLQSWLEDENGKSYGADAYSYWCYGQGKMEGSCWNTFPMMKIPAGTYFVKCSNPKSWSYNSGSSGLGFAKVHAIEM